MTFLVTVGDISLALAPQCCLLLLVLTAASPVSVSQPHQQIHQTCLNTTYHQLSGYLGPLLIFELCFGKLVVKNVFASIDQP